MLGSRRVILPFALVVALLATLAAVATPAAAAPAAAAPGTPAQRTVEFAGASVQVPATWPVVDVDGVPGCVRYDRHAVYLGTPTDTTCPAHLVGRTSTVQILRATPGSTPSGTPIVRAGADGSLGVALGRTGTPRVVVTADPEDATLARAIAASATIGGTAVGTAAVANATAVTDATSASVPAGPAGTRAAHPDAGEADLATSTAAVPTPVTFTGKAFDTCSAPSLSQLRAWESSPYDAVGVYVGGIARGCAQPNLTADWVTATRQRGWHLLPIYVGRQAPCSGYRDRISTKPAVAAQQGTNAAADAVSAMRTLGLGTGNPVYLDMESWDTRKSTCTTAVMAFADAWTVRLHAAGYTSGFYSSAGTGIVALVDTVQQDATFHAPDAVWFARWDGKAITTDPAVPAGLWPDHQRVKQYRGGHDETHGGRTINIDSDAVDGPVTPASVLLTTSALPVAVPGAQYAATLRARGGIAPYTFAVTKGALPAGLSLAKSGLISGTANTMAKPVSVTVTVTDAVGQHSARPLRIAVTFTDVPTSSGFFGDIAWLANTDVTGGYDDGTFRPTNPVTRQSMAAFLYRYSGSDTGTGTCTGQGPFPDVPADNPFCQEITWLAASGITGGYDDGTFRPTVVVSRQAMAAFLYRYTKGDDVGACAGKSPFPDVRADSTFCGAIAWLAASGITGGYDDGTFRPTAVVSRQAMAAFLHRLDQL